MENPTFTYDVEVDLTVANGPLLQKVWVRVDVTPPSGACLIYGRTKDGRITHVEITGHQERELPFCGPTVWVKKLAGATSVDIRTLGAVFNP